MTLNDGSLKSFLNAARFVASSTFGCMNTE